MHTLLLLFSSTFTGSTLAGELFDSTADDDVEGPRPREVEGCGEEDGGGGCSVVAAEAEAASSKSMEEKLMEAAG